ncbi:hypothetical protein ACH4HG_04575 [Streptomyces coeruleorubidus]|jgi:hypothetical protein|uniref:Uncharacterized protein n=1 Tax=Streptomyces coeruleorubidus TaxID=116188 RepID=A0A5J6IAV8_STRC4|nr:MULTISPECIES: hypothetical protein [Streptomyces]QEV27793.1 hypothetical protein CP976_29235 [Streptomyces coeruleorubidus]WOT34322.1 hypothetical protein R5U08_09320 [Streptomyces coeruleorubidus]GGT71266.1 hypothetical protein GCM10010256_32310 [Streptomyces coeruleorubidus]GGT89770.1 hypothetical protein GCM10010244_13480 [Streptomyces bellus]
MPLHFTGVAGDVEVKIGGNAKYRVLAVSWDDEKNLQRYLVMAKERPIWVPEGDITAFFPAPVTD